MAVTWRKFALNTDTYFQFGSSATATQNFTISIPDTPDGTIALKRGNKGAESATIWQITSAGEVGIGGNGISTVRFSTIGTDQTSGNYAFAAYDSLSNGLFSVRNDGIVGALSKLYAGPNVPAYSISGTLFSTKANAAAYWSLYSAASTGEAGFILGSNNTENEANIVWKKASNYIQIASNATSSEVWCIAVSNGVKLTAGATSWVSASDIKLKTDLVPIENAVAKVSRMRHVTGRFKTDKLGTSRAFLIAQDAQVEFPESVHVGTDGSLNMSYTDIVPLHGAAIAELSRRMSAIERNIK